MNQSKDYIHQLAEYIVSNLAKGYTLDSLKYSLMSQGYSRISVDKAIEITNKRLASEIPPIKEKPQIIYKIVTDDSSIVVSENSQSKKSFWKKLIGK